MLICIQVDPLINIWPLQPLIIFFLMLHVIRTNLYGLSLNYMTANLCYKNISLEVKCWQLFLLNQMVFYSRRKFSASPSQPGRNSQLWRKACSPSREEGRKELKSWVLCNTLSSHSCHFWKHTASVFPIIFSKHLPTSLKEHSKPITFQVFCLCRHRLYL